MNVANKQQLVKNFMELLQVHENVYFTKAFMCTTIGRSLTLSLNNRPVGLILSYAIVLHQLIVVAVQGSQGFIIGEHFLLYCIQNLLNSNKLAEHSYQSLIVHCTRYLLW